MFAFHLRMGRLNHSSGNLFQPPFAISKSMVHFGVGERQKVGGQAALRSDSCLCGCDLNFAYQRWNRSSRSSLRTSSWSAAKRWPRAASIPRSAAVCSRIWVSVRASSSSSGALEPQRTVAERRDRRDRPGGGGPGSASAGLRLTLKQANCWPIATVTHGIYVATILLCWCIKSCLPKRQVGRKIKEFLQGRFVSLEINTKWRKTKFVHMQNENPCDVLFRSSGITRRGLT